MSEDPRIARVRAFAAAWKRRDVDALMGLMSDDCEYRASVGPEPGTRYVGRAEVRRGFEAMLRHDDGSESLGGEIVACDELVVARWTYRFTRDDGTRVDVEGVDLFHFDGDAIRCKDAYRKCEQ